MIIGKSLRGIFLGFCLLSFGSQVYAAQVQGKVVYIPQRELTKEKLIEALKPSGAGVMLEKGAKVNCAPYRKEVKEGKVPASNTAQAGLEVLFTFNSAKLGPNATRVLDTLAEALNSPELAAYCFEIQGHTDNVGKPEYNKKLSAQRAASVASYLSSKDGVAKGRLITMGYGQDQPIADNSTDIGRARNRRVQVRNLGPGE